MTIQIKDSDGTVRLSGDLLAGGGATGDVLTQQADGTYAPAAGGGSQAVLAATVPITSAQILGMDLTPVELVAGVVDKAIVPLVAMYRYHFVTTPYNGNPTARYFYGTPGTGWSGSSGSLPLSYSEDRAAFYDLLNSFEQDEQVITDLAGLPFDLDTFTAATTGDGTLTATVLYYLLDVS